MPSFKYCQSEKELINLCKVCCLLLLSIFSGCAVHYYDTKTGAEHIFGLGHMVMKASSPVNSHQAIVRGTDIFGLGLGKSDDGGYLSFGFETRRRIEIINENTTVNLIWPTGSFLETRIGANSPLSIKNRTEENKE